MYRQKMFWSVPNVFSYLPPSFSETPILYGGEEVRFPPLKVNPPTSVCRIMFEKAHKISIIKHITLDLSPSKNYFEPWFKFQPESYFFDSIMLHIFVTKPK